MKVLSPRLVAAFGALLLMSVVKAGTPFPTKSAAPPRDMGSADAAGAALTLTLSMRLRDPRGAETLLREVSDKSSENYHQFLTPVQFRERFGPLEEDVAAVVAHLESVGFTVERAGVTTLRVTGSIANVERAFQVSMHAYELPAHGATVGFRFLAPAAAPVIPTQIAAVVDGVLGLSGRPRYFPHNLKRPENLGASKTEPLIGNSGLINALGSLTVADFAKYYDVRPLTAKNVTGEGRTLAIVTFASFHPHDAFAYWKAVGLKVKSDRITVVNVDGGPGAPSDESGSDETTLDVEQSGGIAPGAAIIVYQGPNTDQAFIDTFVRAIEINKAESISTSWGEWEWFDNVANGAVTDPYSGKTVSSLKALHEVLLQAALQGQSVFAAAGDAGAYDANDGMAPPDYSLALSVDNPAGDSFITAAGGTTLAGKQTFALSKGTLTVTLPHERAWSWDYLEPLCADLDLDPIDCGIFPVGGGGGVSFEFARPFYQDHLAGIQKTQADQVFIDEDTIPPQTVKVLPAHYAGRNVPDISFNADPDTGYSLYYTSDKTGFSVETFYGGTSFVAPQLNGVTALLGQYVHGRLGLLNIPLYALASTEGYAGKDAPFNAIKYGNNDFYTGSEGYNPAVGIGTLDVANFAEALKRVY